MTLKRRRFLAGLGASAVAYPVLGLVGSARSAQPFDFVLNAACADDLPSIENFQVQAGRALTFEGDVARLWFDDLQGRLESLPLSLIGLTRHTDAFVLAELAKPLGYATQNLTSLPDAMLWSISRG